MFSNTRKRLLPLSHNNGLSGNVTMMIENNDASVAFSQMKTVTCKQK